MGKFKLRDYQEQIINEVLRKEKTTKNGYGIFVQSQAGSGKTVMMADLAKKATDAGKRVLFLVHRREIVHQAQKTFLDYGVNPDLLKTEMIQTYANDLKKGKDFKPDTFFIDEAHHSMSPTYRKVWNIYQERAINTGNPINILLFSATPWRLDNQDFLDLVQEDNLICGPTVKDLINRHYLAPFEFYEPSRADLSKLERNGKGDYTQASMAEAVKNISPQDLVRTYKKYCKNGEQALIYAVNVESSKRYAKAFNEAGISAYHLDGASNNKERDDVIQQYREGKIKVLSNVEIFTEGLDLPNASVAFLVRPTQSLSLYIQFAMRVLRYKEGKVAKIFDFAGLHDTFGLPDTDYRWSLQADNPMETAKVGRTKKCPKCNYIFEIDPTEAHKKSVLCPNCQTEIILINPKKDSPFEEFYDEDVAEQESMINSFSQLDTNGINPRQRISSRLPLHVNYQLAKIQLAFPNEDNLTTFRKLLREYQAPFYPTYYELEETEKLTKGSPSQEEIKRLISQNNDLLQELIDSQRDMSVSYSLKQNFNIVKKRLKATLGSVDINSALEYMFQRMKNAKYREYFAINVGNLSPEQITNLIDIEHKDEYIEIIKRWQSVLNTFFNSIAVPLRQIFNAQIFDIEEDDIANCYILRFKDHYNKKYHQAVTPATIVRLASDEKKKNVMENADGYKLLKGQYIKAMPVKLKTGAIVFKLKAEI